VKLRIAFVFVVIAAGVCIYMLLSQRTLSEKSEASIRPSTSEGNIHEVNVNPSSGAIAALNGRLEALAAEVAVLRLQFAAREATTPSVSAIPSAPAMTARDPEALARWEEERHEKMADVEVNFRAEKPDPQWSTVAESTIRNVINNDTVTQGTGKSVECHAQTCRIEMTTMNSVTLSQEVPTLIASFGDQFGSSTMDFIDNQDGGKTAILYLSRNVKANAPGP
jgi:hypothetical protein